MCLFTQKRKKFYILLLKKWHNFNVSQKKRQNNNIMNSYHKKCQNMLFYSLNDDIMKVSNKV